MVWNVFFVFIFSMWVVSSMEGFYQPPRSSVVWGYFTPPLLQRVPSQSQQTPMEAMVELTNNLGVAILQDHSFSRGNFAFSPYGVASVLVVLYEGARSESARQIHRAVGFPLDKDIIRVGFRDIHRHLRSYFSHEGYLSGISLNKDSSSLKNEYKKILKFYGYDVDLNMSLDDEDDLDSGNNSPETSSTNPASNSTTASTPTTEAPSGKNMTNSVKDNSSTSPTTMSSKQSTTQQPAETVTPTVTEPQTTITEEFPQNSTESPGDVESVKTDKPDVKQTTTALPVTQPQEGTTILTTTEDYDEFQINITVENDCKDNCNNTETKNSVNQTETTPLSVETVTESETKTTATATTTTTQAEEITNVSIDNGMLIPQPDDQVTTTTERDTTTHSSEETTSTTETFPASAREAKQLLVDPNINKIREIINSRASLWLTEKTKTRKTRTITDYLKSPHNIDLSLQLQNGMYDTHVSRDADLYRKLPRLLFLVDGAVDTPVPMMIYTNVFSYAYIPRLHSKAMEFPLDDVRYKLLILLPVERRGLRQLIYDLADFPLSNVLETVRPVRVKAMVPTFMVEGFVILTSSLQKLGIWDVFDPRKANLSGMSTDPELYVRNVEQSVTVVIRNYVEILDIQTRTMAARQMEYEFEATHPFLYFVLDTATNVALMAGQILDPLNSRIY